MLIVPALQARTVDRAGFCFCETIVYRAVLCRFKENLMPYILDDTEVNSSVLASYFLLRKNKSRPFLRLLG